MREQRDRGAGIGAQTVHRTRQLLPGTRARFGLHAAEAVPDPERDAPSAERDGFDE